MCESIISIIGTLAGTVLGWGLNTFSQKGKLYTYINNWGELFEMPDGYGGLKLSTSRTDAKHYRCHFDLDIYNSSTNPKIMRSVKIGFYNSGTALLSGTPLDKDSRRSSGAVNKYDEIEAINIQGKSVKVVHLIYELSNYENCFDLLYDSNKVFLTYVNEKNKVKKILIATHDCDELFDSARKL